MSNKVSDAASSNDGRVKLLLRWGLYPLSWFVVLTAFHILLTHEINPRLVWASTIGLLGVTYLLVEWRFPYEQRWSMSFKSFLADMKFAIINTAFVTAVSATLALFAISLSSEVVGPATFWPVPVQLLLCLLIFEAINYSIHRLMHEGRGAVGRILWRVHAAHHLPPRLYLIMHAVFHPLNGILIQVVALVLPIWFMGYNQEVVVMFLIINGFHGLISHFNVDVRMGWLNYLFIGSELHRYHHSAKVNEAKNYGATLSLYDQLFGTFYYKPGAAPKNLGVSPKSGLPPYERSFDVLKLPFVRK